MEGVGKIVLKKMKLKLPEGGFRFASGGVLKEIEVAYEECGVPIAEGNVIFICHALTGDAHVAGIKPGEDKPSGWWEEMVGPGRAFDTNRFHIVCANVLGGCSGTTGPRSTNPETGKPYGSSFPQYNFSEAVDVYRMLLKQLGVGKLAAVVGGSYGGIMVTDWMTRCPEEMDKVCLIATSAELNTQAIAFSVMSRTSITDDPAWKGGDYYEGAEGKCGEGPRAGLAAARQLAHVTYLSRELLQEKFQRRLQDNFVNAPEHERAERDRLFKTYFQIESYLDYQALKFVRRFDANSYLHITRSMDLFSAADRYGGFDEAFARVKAKVLVVSYAGDILFPDWQSKDIVSSLLRNKKDVSYCHLEAGTGHDSFLTDISDLSGLVSGFLLPRKPKIMKWQERLYRNVTRMVGRGSRVLDIGCGDGTLLNILREKLNCNCSGVDIEIDPFKESLADGNHMYWEDADRGLSVIPDRQYDLAICSDTLQEVRNPRGLLREALRVADEAIVSFPNFAAYRIRLQLAFRGRLPVSKALPFQWYDTPNIHCITLKDFRALCEAENLEIVEVRAESRHLLGKLLLALGMKNLGASKIVARIRRKTMMKESASAATPTVASAADAAEESAS